LHFTKEISKYKLTYSRKHHYWGLQSGTIMNASLEECEVKMNELKKYYPDFKFKILLIEKNESCNQ
jgi:hypothetical protein